ncbi:MAG: hypothetical protein ACJAVN_001656 [Roseivirga sp.]|jgi:hypothetical protein
MPSTNQDRYGSDDHFVNQVFFQKALNGTSTIDVESMMIITVYF